MDNKLHSTATAAGDPSGHTIGITNLEEELGESRALRNVLSAPGVGGRGSANAPRVLQHLDGRVIEDVILLLISLLSGEEYQSAAVMCGGADNYTIKVPSISELDARIRAALRRMEPQESEVPRAITIREIELDPIRRTVRRRDHLLHLSPKEFDLLHYLMARAGIPVRHAELLRKIWGVEYGQELEYLRTYIYQLRQKLEDDPKDPRRLLTEPYFGYRFAESAAPPIASVAQAAYKQQSCARVLLKLLELVS